MTSHERSKSLHKRPRRREFTALGFDFTDVAEEHERAARSRAKGTGREERDAPAAVAAESVSAETFPFLNPEKT